MRLLTFAHAGQELPGLLMGLDVLPLPFDSLQALIAGGAEALAQVHALAQTPAGLLPLAEVRLRAPLPHPPSLRDFYAFEQHVLRANENRGREMPPAWYDFPVFYFSNPGSIFGPDDTIPYPDYTQALDYELEIAVIIGQGGIDIAAEQAAEHIFGYTIMNDWSARDIQRQEMSVGLGPAKGKDFATSLGPLIVTPDELASYATPRPGVYDLAMSARVNGQERSRSSLASIYYDFGQIIAHASRAVRLYPGDVLGSGTAGGGCLLELTRGEGPWLLPGDVVELEISAIGVLRNTIAGGGCRWATQLAP